MKFLLDILGCIIREFELKETCPVLEEIYSVE